MTIRWGRRRAAWLWCFVTLLVITIARSATAAYVPPPIAGHVTDAAGKLTPSEIAQLDAKLSDYRKCSGNHIAVFYPRSLDGYSIEDVAYVTFNTWKIGDSKKDNGALLVLAPNERKIRIETGKGVGGDLTDVESAHILKEVVGPNMKAERFFAAADQATTRIGKALGGCAVADIGEPARAEPPAPRPLAPAPAPRPPAAKPAPSWFDVMPLLGGAVLVLVIAAGIGLRGDAPGIILASVVLTGLFTGFTTAASTDMSEPFNADTAYGCFFFAALALVVANGIIWVRRIRGTDRGASDWTAGGSSWSSASDASTTSSWASSSNDSSWSSSSSSFSSGGGSDYSGGGGSSGGGGASDSY